MRLNAFNFNATWRCNLNCHYCGYRASKADETGKYKLKVTKSSLDGEDKEFDINGEMHWAMWVACLERFRPFHLEFAGGEPCMYQGFLSLTQHIPPDSSYAVTSNTLLTDVIKETHPRSSLCWTASYHFKQFDNYRQNIDLLQRKGFRVNSTMVISPDNWKEADEMLGFLSVMRVGITVQPAITFNFSWDDHREILEHFKRRQQQFPFFINPLERPAWEKRDPVSACSAGVNYFVAFPDGTLYRCLTDMVIRKHDALGNIKNFTPYAFEHPCEDGCVCGCDVDAKNGKWDDAETHVRTAIR